MAHHWRQVRRFQRWVFIDSAVELQPADIVAQPSVVKYERANRLRGWSRSETYLLDSTAGVESAFDAPNAALP
jgi:hypothetical protein